VQPVIPSPLGAWAQSVVLALSPIDVFCVIAAMLIIHLSRYAGMWVYALIALPGTIAHELAHFCVAWIFGAQPAFPSLIPVRTQRGWQLGSVSFRVGRARALPIAMAPLLLAPLALCWAAWLMHPAPLPWYCLHVWMVAALLTASIPSRTDFKLALPGLAVLGVLVLIACTAWAVIWQHH
jgi:hypothetical protein